MIRILAPLLLVGALAGSAHAQDLVVLVVEDETSDAERDAIAAALRDELGLEVRSAETTEPGQLALRVTIRDRRARLEVTRPERARIVRTVLLPRDEAGRLHALVTLAVNLTRDEAAELLSSLRRPSPEDAIAGDAIHDGAIDETQAAEVEAAEVATASIAVEADRASMEPDTATQELPARVEAVDTERPTAEVSALHPRPASTQRADPWRHRVLRLGASGHLGTAPDPGGGLVAIGLYGVDVVASPIPELGLGVRDLGALTDGDGPVLVLAPVVEGALRLHARVALHAILGCDLQLALHGNQPFSVAPRLGLGARAYLDPIFSIALDLTGRVVATDVFHTTPSTLPSGAVLLTIGLSFAFHIG